MTTADYRFCPRCAQPLIERADADDEGGRIRQACPDDACGYVHWNNPLPVVAAIVEIDGKILLARNAAWPEGAFALITGFLERGETPEDGIARSAEMAVRNPYANPRPVERVAIQHLIAAAWRGDAPARH